MIERLIRSAVWISLVSLYLCAGTAFAQAAPGTTLSTDDKVARGLFQAGSAAYEAGRYEEALSFFEQAYTRCGRAELLFNVGQSADRLRQDDKALKAFKAFLERKPDAANRAQVESRVAALERAQAAREASTPIAPASATADAPHAAPTPAETAATTQGGELTDGDQALTRADEGPALTERWWFWTGIGAVVLGGAAVAVVIATGGDDASRAAPYEGNGGSLRGP